MQFGQAQAIFRLELISQSPPPQKKGLSERHEGQRTVDYLGFQNKSRNIEQEISSLAILGVFGEICGVFHLIFRKLLSLLRCCSRSLASGSHRRPSRLTADYFSKEPPADTIIAIAVLFL